MYDMYDIIQVYFNTCYNSEYGGRSMQDGIPGLCLNDMWEFGISSNTPYCLELLLHLVVYLMHRIRYMHSANRQDVIVCTYIR